MSKSTDQPTVMPSGWEPKKRGRPANPSWQVAVDNPGRWVSTTLKAIPRQPARFKDLPGRFRYSASSQGRFLRYDPKP